MGNLPTSRVAGENRPRRGNQSLDTRFEAPYFSSRAEISLQGDKSPC